MCTILKNEQFQSAKYADFIEKGQFSIEDINLDSKQGKKFAAC